MERPTPHTEALPGGWPQTPAESLGQRESRNHSYTSYVPSGRIDEHSPGIQQQGDTYLSWHPETTPNDEVAIPLHETLRYSGSSGETAIPSDSEASPNHAAMLHHPTEEVELPETVEKRPTEQDPAFAPVKTTTSSRPKLSGKMTEEDFFRTLSRRRTSQTSGLNRAPTQEDEDDREEIDRLMSRMFGKSRQEHSEEEQTRHVGIIFKNLTVKGVGLGAALQPTVGDILLGLPRKIKNLVSRGPKQAAGKPQERTILSDFSGTIKPGEMLLVLGHPGSGCTTLLKTLANQRAGYTSIDGEVTYGGTPAEEMGKKYKGEVLFIPDEDLHYATITVKNTLSFALKTKTPGKDSRLEGESRGAYVKEFLRIVTKLFWIEHTLGTKVGNEYIRGVSGGEKKRVTIAEAMVTRASAQCWDNSTKGLDASTALEYVQSLRSLTNMARISTAVALYQAGESLYDCFDKVVLLHEGKCCYFGHTEDAVEYFRELGFVQPDRWTSADFITSVTDEHERHVKEGWENKIPRSGEDFDRIFQQSEQKKRNLKEIEEFEGETQKLTEARHEAQTKATRKKNFEVSLPKQVMACTQRQFLVMIGDKQATVGKWGGIGFQALIVGSLFYNQPKTVLGAFPRGAVFQSRPILLKHKSYQFYRPSAFAIAQTVVDIPLVFVQVFIFDIVVYFMSGLQRTASQFFISLMFLWIVTMTMYALFRAVGSLVASLDVATRITGPVIQILVVYTGYLIPPRKMHPWFAWLRWVNPVQYGFEGLMANEFYNLELQCVPPYLVPPNAPSAEYQSCALQGSTPGSPVVNGADYIQTAFTYSRSHLWRNFGFICAFFLFFVALTAIGMELQKPNKGGGEVTVFKRGQVPRSVEKDVETGGRATDEESGEANSGQVDATPNNDEAHKESDSDDTVAAIGKNETIFTWQDVNYTIPYEGGERKLLQDVSGFVRPGKLTALMGASGAGKTTLLNTLAQRINFGVVSGDFLVDGKPLPRSFQRATGFAEQSDVHEPTATVREALRFSAKLRQPKEVSLDEKYDYCEKVIDLLEMRDIAGAAIGKVGEGLNPEQRKRLTIAVELASKPELLMFLDEPTSGLDSGAAFNIVRFLRKLADAGQAILCTIHQPSSVLFEEFDELLLLKSGGRTVYHGELGDGSKNLIKYLEKNGEQECPADANPAEWMLEAIGAGNPDYNGPDFGDLWEKSKEKEQQQQEIKSMIQERRKASDGAKTDDDREYAMPLGTQINTVVKRSFIAYWRSPQYVVGKFMLHIFTALFNGFTFWNLGNSQIDMQSRLFSIFMTLTISPPLIQQLQPRFLNFRDLYQSREANSKIYSWVAFVIGAIVVEIPYSLVAGTIYWCAWYFPPGFPRGTYRAASVWLFIMSFELFYIGFGQAIASFAANELLASLLVPMFFLFVVSFCGVVVPYVALPTFWKAWMYWLSPFKYLLEGLLALVTHGLPLECDSQELASFPAPPGQTCDAYAGPYAQQSGGYVITQANGLCGFCQYRDGDAFAASFNVYWTYVWRDYGIFWAYIIFNFAVVFVCSWLYLQGVGKIKKFFSPAARKQKKAAKQRENESQNEKA
ncbi:ABC drug exporter AtrF [Aureobasidium pullulans]|uniref:ABC drug exporter AtrF n=1 Tax=Aureobasidium pullulans TaxID=5580 RepID=A0A4S9M1G8_AURPU|nr:ABC drug exporter AtrF [Aureobasidium pullulans]